jgi:adenylate cyclase
MVEERARRKLSAILSADVKGFSRLMSQDEEATVKTLKQHRATISGLVSEHRGRVAPFKDPAVTERDMELMRKAGLPD